MTEQRRWLPLLLDFVSHIKIDSKETGTGVITLYESQRRFLEEVCLGLDAGQRFMLCLKARQLGISTIELIIDLFWLLVHPGMQGALITDTEGNRDKFRLIINRIWHSLPKRFRGNFRLQTNNRTLLEITDGKTSSVLDYLVAGTKKGGNLGRSRAYNFVHATETAMWGDPEGIDSLIASLAETHPDRLYIFESTAKGMNHFFQMWTKAKEDTYSQRAFFIGWWAKESYRIEKSDPRFAEFMTDPLTQAEEERIEEIRTRYHHNITPEQWAWRRYREAHRTLGEGTFDQEFPDTEDVAFVVTGNHYFPAKRLTTDLRRVIETPIRFKAYRYEIGDQFTTTSLDYLNVDPVQHSFEAELRVWHPPVKGAAYAMGVDPAYGRTDWADRHCISVWRCFADRMVQVAEYATPDPETYQVIWVLGHLAAMYRDCRINIEIDGSGTAVMQGLNHFKALLRAQRQEKGEPPVPKDFTDALGAARWYLFHRPDSMSSGYAYGYRSDFKNKFTLMNQFRDSFLMGLLEVNSGPLLQEMKTIVQDGTEICAYGKGKDDRVFAAAYANKAWVDWIRPPMVANQYTYAKAMEAEAKGREVPEGDSFVGGIVKMHFALKEQDRKDARRAAAFQLGRPFR